MQAFCLPLCWTRMWMGIAAMVDKTNGKGGGG